MDIVKQAQQMVDATSILVGGRTINIMDENAIIIASSDNTRIGAFHAGASDVLKIGKEVAIFENDLEKFKGAKTGYNMPISYNGKIVGVVGIAGNPDEVCDAARLLCLYVGQWYEQNAKVKQHQAENEMKQRFARALIYKNSFSTEIMWELAHSLSIQLEQNCCVAIISCKNNDARGAVLGLSSLSEKTEEFCKLNSVQYVSCTENDKLVVIFFGIEVKTARQAYKYCKERAKMPFSFSVGGVVEKIEEICVSYNQVCAIDHLSVEGWHSLDISSDAMRYLLNVLCREAGDLVLAKYNKHLNNNLSEKEIDVFLNTALVYYENSCSVNKSAEQLNVHKNTVLYRVHKVHEALEISDEHSFAKELVVRILYIYRKQINFSINGDKG